MSHVIDAARIQLVACLLSVAAVASAQPAAQSFKGLEVSASAVTHAPNVSLSDCPAGANIVRGVIKPGDPMEFASVTVDFKVLPAFKAGPLPKPVLYDESGKAYNTAQSFGEVSSATPTFSCTFSFRVPTGTKPKKLTLDTATLDLTALAK